MISSENRWVISGLLLVTVAAGVALIFPRDDRTPTSCQYGPSVDQVYRVQIATEFAADQGALLSGKVPGGRASVSEHLDGDFLIHFEALPQGQGSNRLTTTVYDAVPGGPADLRVGRPLSFELTIDSRCSILDIRFIPGSGNEDPGMVHFMEGLFRILDFYLPDSAATEWERMHGDKTGTYLAAYESELVDGGAHRVDRKRERYMTVSTEMAASGYSAHVVESDVTAVVEPGGFWLSEVHGVEDLSILKDGRAVLQNRVVFDMQRSDDVSLAHVMAQSDREDASEGASAGAANALAAEPASPDDSSSEPEKQPLSEATADALIDGFETQLREGGMADAVDLLAEALKEQPELADRLAERMLSGEMESRHVALAFLALSEAGTRSAVGVLEVILEDSTLSSQRRSQAAFALASVKPPSMVTATALAEQLDRVGTGESRASQSALMALGQMARNIANPDNPTRTFIREIIETQFQLSTTESSLAAALSAAHNSGDAGLNAAVEQQLSNSSSQIRRLAVEALGSMGTPSGRDALLGHLTSERDTAIQTTTVESLAEVIKRQGEQAQEHETAEIAGLMSRTQDAKLRQAAVRFLGAQDSDAARRALLARVAVEKDPDVLHTLGQVLSGEELISVQGRQ